MEDLLWETTEGLSHSALCLDNLEDFNMMDEEVLDMKSQILKIWKEQDKPLPKASTLGPSFTPRGTRGQIRGLTPGSCSSVQNLFSGMAYSSVTIPVGPGSWTKLKKMRKYHFWS